MKRRTLLKLAPLSAGICALPALAQSSTAAYPDRPVKIIVQFPAGTTPDNLARLAAEQLRGKLNQPFVVENKPGAAGNIAAEFVAKSPADGYTLLLGQVGLTWTANLFPNLKFDPAALKPVSIIADSPFVLAANPSLPANNIAEFIQLSKTRPGGLKCATSGPGSPQHLIAELFMKQTGAKLDIIPYRGSSQVIPDLLAGHIDVLFTAAEGVLPFFPDGKLRPLATVDKARLPLLPNVPTLREAGVDIATPMWVGLFAPPNTPNAVVQRIANELRTMRNNADALRKITSVGNNVVLSTPEEMQRAFTEDSRLWGGIVKSAGIKVTI